jgi:hypothetical protein
VVSTLCRTDRPTDRQTARKGRGKSVAVKCWQEEPRRPARSECEWLSAVERHTRTTNFARAGEQMQGFSSCKRAFCSLLCMSCEVQMLPSQQELSGRYCSRVCRLPSAVLLALVEMVCFCSLLQQTHGLRLTPTFKPSGVKTWISRCVARLRS